MDGKEGRKEKKEGRKGEAEREGGREKARKEMRRKEGFQRVGNTSQQKLCILLEGSIFCMKGQRFQAGRQAC